MSGFHILTYRPGDGTTQVIRISDSRDLSDVLGTIQDRLYQRTPLEKARQAAEADAILKGRK